jgi:hypothetical protein
VLALQHEDLSSKPSPTKKKKKKKKSERNGQKKKKKKEREKWPKKTRQLDIYWHSFIQFIAEPPSEFRSPDSGSKVFSLIRTPVPQKKKYSHYNISLYPSVSFFFFVVLGLELKGSCLLGRYPHTCQPFFVLGIFEVGLTNYLPKLASNLDPRSS